MTHEITYQINNIASPKHSLQSDMDLARRMGYKPVLHYQFMHNGKRYYYASVVIKDRAEGCKIDAAIWGVDNHLRYCFSFDTCPYRNCAEV